MRSAGERLGPYELLSPLGEGGMGEVWRARDTRLDRTVAVKFSKSAFTERFEREARAIGALNHPNICTLHDVGPDYLVMELVEGLPPKGPMPPEKAVEIGRQILNALAAAHETGLTHRDLKPANILLTKQGVKLLDFGLAKHVAPLGESGETLTKALTGDGAIVGTLQYMAPEQLQGKPADARSDLFAFGCVLYELLSGKRAFEGENAASVIAAILTRDPAKLETAPPLARVILRCLAKDPADRFQTARDLNYNLDLALAPVVVAVAPRRLFGPAVAMLALLAGGGLGWMLHRARAAGDLAPMMRFQLNPPPGTSFRPGLMDISPDGRTLAFTAMTQGKSEIYLQRLDGRTARKVPNSTGASKPSWSLDGKALAFVADRKLWRYDVESAAPPVVMIQEVDGFGTPVWLNDGSVIAGAKRLRPDGVVESAPEQAMTGQQLPDDRFLRLDDRMVVAESLREPRNRGVLTESANFARYAAGTLFWLRDRTLLAQEWNLGSSRLEGTAHVVADDVARAVLLRLGNFSVSNNGRVIVHGPPSSAFRLTWLNRKGEMLGVLGKPGPYGPPAISPDGRRVLVNLDEDIVVIDIDRQIASPITAVPPGSSYPVWSSDGSKFAYRGGTDLRTHVRPVNSADGEQVLGAGRPFDWSRDGRHLLFASEREGREIMVVAFDSRGHAQPARPWRPSSAFQRSARFSPDGRWLALVENESGGEEVFVQSFAGRDERIRISAAGGLHPAWSPDGKEIYYLDADRLMAVAVKEVGGVLRVEPPRALFPLKWVRNVAASPYTEAPDGRFLVKMFDGAEAQHLEVVLNWRPPVR